MNRNSQFEYEMMDWLFGIAGTSHLIFDENSSLHLFVNFLHTIRNDGRQIMQGELYEYFVRD